MDPIAAIKELGIPTNSMGNAIVHMNENGWLEQSQYESLIKTISGISVTFDNQLDARCTCLYLIQESIRKSENTDVFDMQEMLELATELANKFIRENPWHWATADEPKSYDSNGNVRKKKGAKQINALRIYNENIGADKQTIIKLFMSELDMSKSGATTYFYNVKKRMEQ